MANINEALKTDIAFVNGYVRAPNGDIGRISGLANLKNALFHRLITVPGTLVHRPDYGVGVSRFQNAPSSFTVQQKLAGLIVEQFKRDPRVEDVSSVSISPAANPEQTTIVVRVKVVGYAETQMNFTPFGGA